MTLNASDAVSLAQYQAAQAQMRRQAAAEARRKAEDASRSTAERTKVQNAQTRPQPKPSGHGAHKSAPKPPGHPIDARKEAGVDLAKLKMAQQANSLGSTPATRAHVQAALKHYAASMQRLARSAGRALNDAQVALGGVQLGNNKQAIAKARVEYDHALEFAKQASSQADLALAASDTLQAEHNVDAANAAYAKTKFAGFDLTKIVDYDKAIYSNGYDPTAVVLPPSDFAQKAIDGDSGNAAADGTRGEGNGIYRLQDGTRVQRSGSGEWTVLNLHTGDLQLTYPKAMNPLTAHVWESRYQAAQAGARFNAASSDANRKLPLAIDGSQPQLPTIAADLNGRLASDQQAVDQASRKLSESKALNNPLMGNGLPLNGLQAASNSPLNALPNIGIPGHGASTLTRSPQATALPGGGVLPPTPAPLPGEQQKLAADLDEAKARLELTQQLISWQSADKAYLTARLADPRQACSDKPLQDYREASDDAFARVQRAQSALNVAQAKAGVVDAKAALDTVPPGPAASAQRQQASDRYTQAAQLETQAAAQLQQSQAYEAVTSQLNSEQLNDPVAVHKALQAPQAPKQAQGSRADSLLESLVGGLEVVGGVALGAGAGWTGIGAVAAVALIADGGTRVVHGGMDAARNETTDPYLSQGLQHFGMGESAANRIDTGVSLVTSVGSGGPGTVKLGLDGVRAFRGVTVAGEAAKGLTAGQFITASGKLTVGVGSTAMLADTGWAQGRYAFAGQMEAPIGTQLLMRTGLSETQANYAEVLGGLGVGVAAPHVAPVAERFGPFVDRVIEQRAGERAAIRQPGVQSGAAQSSPDISIVQDLDAQHVDNEALLEGTHANGGAPQGAPVAGTVQTPSALRVDNKELLKGTPTEGDKVKRPAFIGKKQGLDLRARQPADAKSPTAAQRLQIQDILGPSPDGSFTARGARRFAPPGLQPDKVQRVFVVSTDGGAMKNGRPLRLDHGATVYARPADALNAAKKAAEASPDNRVVVFAVQDHGGGLPSQIHRGVFSHRSLVGAVSVDSRGDISPRSWANRQHSQWIAKPGEAFRRPAKPLTKASFFKLMGLQLAIEGSSSAAAFATADALGWSTHEMKGAAIAAASASAYRKLIPSLQTLAQLKMGRSNEALVSILNEGKLGAPATDAISLDRSYRRRLVGPQAKDGSLIDASFGIPMARRERYLKAIETLKKNPKDSDAISTLEKAGVDLYRKEFTRLERRSKKFLDPHDQAKLSAALRRIRAADSPEEARAGDWQTVAHAALEDMVRRHSGLQAGLHGLPASDDYRLAEELLRRNPKDAGALALIKGAAGNTFRINTSTGLLATGLQAIAYAFSRVHIFSELMDADAGLAGQTQKGAGEGYHDVAHAAKTVRASEETVGVDVSLSPSKKSDESKDPKTYAANLGFRRLLSGWTPNGWLLVQNEGGMVKPRFFNGRIQLMASRSGAGLTALFAGEQFTAGMEALAHHRYAEAAVHFGEGFGAAVLTQGMHKDAINAYRKTRGLPGAQYLGRGMHSFDGLPKPGAPMLRGLPPAALILTGASLLFAWRVWAAFTQKEASPTVSPPPAILKPCTSSSQGTPLLPGVPSPASTMPPAPHAKAAVPRSVTVDHRHRDTATLEGIAYANRADLPDQAALHRAAARGQAGVRREALRQLLQLNERYHFDLPRADHRVQSRPPGDPDFIRDGWVIRVAG